MTKRVLGMTAVHPIADPKQTDKGAYSDTYLEWKNWGDTRSFGELSQQSARYYAAEIKKTGLSRIRNVLEIGFGNGSFLAFARNNNWTVTGTEMNEALVSLARSKGYDAHQAGFLSALGQGGFDLIVAFDVLEHIEQSRLAGFLTTIRKLLAADGVFVARFPNGDSPFGLAAQNGDITHLTTLGSGKLHYFATNCGFSIVHMGGAAEPILCGGFLHRAHMLVTVPIKFILEKAIHLIFFPRSKINFLSPNLVVALKNALPTGCDNPEPDAAPDIAGS